MSTRNGQGHGTSLRPSDAEAEVTSDYEPSVTSSGFTSIETATRYHVYENGRRYQSFMEGRYPLPNDELEQNREEIMHSMIKEVHDGRLFMAPIGENPQKILDLGTGCGIWAIEVGDKFPSAHIIGIDLSPIQPYYAPPNVEWKIDDLETEWPAAYRDADFIHAWSFLPTVSDPARLLSSARSYLRPGGWIEVGDISPVLDPRSQSSAPFLTRFFSLVIDTFSPRYSWSPNVTASLPSLLSAAGFTSISVRRERLPLGPEAGGDRRDRVVGLYMQVMMEAMVGAVLARRRDLGVEDDEAGALAEGVAREMRDPGVKVCLWWSSIWAQRPA